MAAPWAGTSQHSDRGTSTQGPIQFPWLQAEETQALLQAASSCTDLPLNRETKVNNREVNNKVNNREVLWGQAARAVCVSTEHGYRLCAHP